jgi:hypothetical protein
MYCMATTMHTKSSSANPPIFIALLLHWKIKSPIVLCICLVRLQPVSNNNLYMDRTILQAILLLERVNPHAQQWQYQKLRGRKKERKVDKLQD